MKPLHPGIYIRKHVLPSDINVTDAAKLLGVSRVALSRLLNGKSDLSAAMAQKIATTFDFPIDKLLSSKNVWNDWKTKQIETNPEQKLYVPRLLDFKAKEIDEWANAISSRERFPVLMRALIHSSNHSIESISVPGNDHSQKRGFDGVVVTTSSSPWVPKGYSYWEFGTNQNPLQKANEDFSQSLKKLPKENRLKSTYVFVTPRNWKGKDKWLEKANSSKEWKKVLAYDAETLEEWIEQSIAGQIWLADELNKPNLMFHSLDYYWKLWADGMNPSIKPRIYSSAKEKLLKEIRQYLESSQEIKPLHIRTSNIKEAFALLALAFDEYSTNYFPIVCKSPDLIPRVFEVKNNFLPIFFDKESSEAFLPYCSRQPSIILCTPEFMEPHTNQFKIIDLPRPNDVDIQNGLTEMGLSLSEIDRVKTTMGNSIPVLRRRYTCVSNQMSPDWGNIENAKHVLLPLFFIGKWQLDNRFDSEIITSFSEDLSYEQIKKEATKLAKLPDAPCKIGKELGAIISREEVFYTVINEQLSENLIRKIFNIANIFIDYLLTDSPKTKYSNELVEGFFSSLAYLSDVLKKSPYSLIFSQELNKFVNTVFKLPLSTRFLTKIDSILPLLAEIIPKNLSRIFKQDLDSGNNALLNLLEPTKNIFSQPNYLGLLKALEKLTWIRESALNALSVLFKLATKPLNENWANSPLESLKYIFDTILPQTGLSLIELSDIFEKMKGKYPELCWQIAMSIMDPYGAQLTQSPVWIKGNFRTLQVTTKDERQSYLELTFQTCLQWQSYDAEMINSLIKIFYRFKDKKYMSAIWNLIEKWKLTASDTEQVKVKDQIRSIYFSRPSKADSSFTLSREGNRVFHTLGSDNLYISHLWLFKNYSPDIRIKDSQLSITEQMEKQKQKGQTQRKKSLTLLINNYGINAILELLSYNPSSITANLVAETASLILDKKAVIQFAIEKIIDHAPIDDTTFRIFSRTLLGSENTLKQFCEQLRSSSCSKTLTLLLLNAPFNRTIWDFVAELPKSTQNEYWQNVHVDDCIWNEDLNYVLERLYNVNRLSDCLRLFEYQYKSADIQLQYKVLLKLSYPEENRTIRDLLSKENIQYLLESVELTTLQKLTLEAAFCKKLVNGYFHNSDRPELLNIEKLIESQPLLFSLLAQNSFNADLQSFSTIADENSENLIRALCHNAHWILMSLQHIPGCSWNNSEIDIKKTINWVNQVLEHTPENDVAYTKYEIGSLFSHCDKDSADLLWPNHQMCKIIEQLGFDELARGFVNGYINSRGCRWIDEKSYQSDEEKALLFEELTQKWCIKYPFVCETIFSMLAKEFHHSANSCRTMIEQQEL